MKVKEILTEQGVPQKGKALWGGNLKSGKAKYGKKPGSQTLPGYSRAGDGGEKIKPRPKKNLWFQNFNGWNADLRFDKGNFTMWRLKRNAQEEEEIIFAGDDQAQTCYGYWRPKKNQGMTFFKPRSFNNVKHPRDTLEKLEKGIDF